MILESVEHSIVVRVTVAGHRNDYMRIGDRWHEDWASGMEVAEPDQAELDRLYREWCRKEGGGEKYGAEYSADMGEIAPLQGEDG